MLALLILAVLAIVPADPFARDSVDRLELNNFYDDQGRLVFTQLVGWDESNRCRFWRMCKCQPLRPERDHVRGGWALRWWDGDVPRDVHARSFDETWTQYDPELVDREYFPAEQRRKLRANTKGQ